MHVARGCGGNRPLYQLFKEYELESGDIKEKYNSKVFQWYRRRLQCLCDGTVSQEDAPAKNLGEAWGRTKTKTKAAWASTGEKTSSLAQRADQKLLSNRVLGGLWKKIRKVEDSKEQEAEQIPSLVGAAANEGMDSDEDADFVTPGSDQAAKRKGSNEIVLSHDD